MARPLPNQPIPAPQVVMDATGVYWRRYHDHLSIAPTSTTNDPTIGPLAVFALVGWEGVDGRIYPSHDAALAAPAPSKEGC